MFDTVIYKDEYFTIEHSRDVIIPGYLVLISNYNLKIKGVIKEIRLAWYEYVRFIELGFI